MLTFLNTIIIINNKNNKSIIYTQETKMGKAAKLRKRIHNKSQYESQKEQQDVGMLIAQINGINNGNIDVNSDKQQHSDINNRSINSSITKANKDTEMNSASEKYNAGGIGKCNMKKARNYGKKSKKIALLNQEKSSKLMTQKDKSRSALKKALKGI